MNPEHWSRLKAIFHLALETPVEARAELLRREAGGDARLIAEVQALIDSHESAGAFLEASSVEERVAALEAGNAQLGERIGAYRIVEMIGTGGMGDVFKAVRDDEQYRAEVAIKLMRADVRNPLAEQRFKTERQILAALDHRNIARLLDGGTTAAGLPYVVMELVTGEPIDRYCESRSLGTPERVQLFLQVCSAVSFAHQHLVVHRDLKPNNILVTADGSVKLLDFGIAKLIEPQADTGTAGEETRTQLRAMTLEYASPEQVSGGTVTTVSDVYSLGVVLYRLLTGQSPYRTRGNDAARVAEILSDTSPTRPSQLETQTRQPIDADLDHVLLMALRKEPAKRYASVEQFAGDLRNYLAGRPVSARRGTLGYRFGKYMRRNKVVIAAAGLVVALLFGGMALVLREARIAEAERQIAQRHFASVRKLANKLFDFHDEIATLQGATKAREMLVKTSLEYLDALYKEAGNDLALKEELGLAYRKVGDLQGSPNTGNTGDPKAALSSYAKSVALLEPLYATAPKNARIGALLARAYRQQGHTLFYAQGAQAASATMRKAVATAEASQSGFADEYARMKLLVESYWLEAMVTTTLGDTPEGMAAVERMVAAAEVYSVRHPQDTRRLAALDSVYSNASLLNDPRLTAHQSFERNVGFARKAIAAGEAAAAAEPTVPNYRWSVAKTRANLANEFIIHDRYAEALEQLRLALPALAERASDRNDANAQMNNSIVQSALAWSLFKLGHVDEAERRMRTNEKALAGMMESGGDTQIAFILAEQRIRLGELFVSRDSKEYRRAAREVISLGLGALRKLKQAYPELGEIDALHATGAALLARVEAAPGRTQSAEPDLRH